MNQVEFDQRRTAILNVYPNSTTWAYKVDRMSPAQVNAIYIRFKSEGKLR